MMWWRSISSCFLPKNATSDCLATSGRTVRTDSGYVVLIHDDDDDQCRRCPVGEGVGGRKSVNLPWPGGPEWDPEPDYVAHIFVFLDSIMIESQSFRFRGFSVKTFSRSALVRGVQKFFFSPRPEAALGGPNKDC
jgi:hypothetical protein